MSNPRSSEVMKGAEIYDEEGCDLVVAVGGGSPMDCGKAIGAVASNQCDVLELEGVDEVALPAPPLYAYQQLQALLQMFPSLQ
ncbi:MAG: iron-containing alcohol dehydrogenase [Methanolobus sp.]